MRFQRINELANKGQTNQPLKTETAMLGTTAVLNLPKAIELPKIDPKPLLILGAEAAVPAAAIGSTVGGVVWTGHQIVSNAHRKWEEQTRIDALPLPPTIITNKTEEPMKPETATAEKTKPQVQPIPDEVDLPRGELVVRPKAQPQTPTKVDNPTSPTSPTENIPSPYKPNQPSPPQFDPTKLIPPIIGASTASIGKIVADATKNDKVETPTVPHTPGTYSTKIKWGIQDIEARPFGVGFWGKRVPQSNPRVDAYEQKINPNNESYYIPHPNGGYVQFENIKGIELQDGKLVMQTDNSIYKIYNKPEFLRAKVLAEAQRQVEAAKYNNLKVEWLISDKEAVNQLTRFFKENGVDIKVTHFPE